MYALYFALNHSGEHIFADQVSDSLRGVNHRLLMIYGLYILFLPSDIAIVEYVSACRM